MRSLLNIKNLIQIIALCVMVFTSSGCAMSALSVAGAVSALQRTTPPTVLRPKTPSSIVICRAKECAPARLSMTREYVYNSILHLMDNNNGTDISVCDADPTTHMCYENYLQYKIVAGVTPAIVVMDSAKLLDVQLHNETQTIETTMDYSFYLNGIKPKCRASKNIIYVKSADYVIMEDTAFDCKLTSVSRSRLSTVYAIDYIDLDYGIVGAHYSIGVSGPAYGGGNGYMIMRFANSAYPVEPRFIKMPEQTPAAQPVKSTGNEQIKQSPTVGEETKTDKIEEGQYKVSPLPLK